MFGRRKRDEDEETAKEAERRALFEELAKRPDTVCPFLGLASARAEYRPEPNGEHRCYAFGDPAPLADEQQRHVCLERGYSNCPRYLRGVLVIPSEELEALRRPQPHVAPPPSPKPVAERRSRRGLLVIPLIVVLLAAIGAGGWYLLNKNNEVVVVPSPTPSPSANASASASAIGSASPTGHGSASPLATPTPLPTPTTGATFIGYWVVVSPGPYTVYKVDAAGTITDTLATGFTQYSHATVSRVVASNGLLHWRSLDALTGYSYISGRSGPFQVYRVYRSPDGSYSGILIPANQT